MYLEKLKLEGKVAVVTGAGQGIGAACARALGEAGAKVIVADFNPWRSPCQRLIDFLSHRGNNRAYRASEKAVARLRPVRLETWRPKTWC